MTIWPILERARALHPDELAVVDGELHLRYRELEDRARRLAGFLAARGLAPGERIAILDRNSSAFLETTFAAAAAGLILVPLNTRLAAPELAAILADADASLLVARTAAGPLVERVLREQTPLRRLLWLDGDGPAAPLAASRYEDALACSPAAPRRLAPEEVAQLYYTSGTTGRPKGVMLTHRNVCTHALAAIAELGLHDGDRWGHLAPMFHLADAWASFALTWVGGRHVMLGSFSPEAALALIERERVTVTNLIPTMLNLMLRHPEARTRDLSSLRLLLSGGAPIAPELVRVAVRVFGCDYQQTYGMTETSPYLTLSRLSARLAALPEEERLVYLAKTGRPFLGVELRVVDQAGEPVVDDDRSVGEIVVRGETVTPGYWRAPEATRSAFRDGWLLTGDLATVDAHGYVTIVDRKKDMIICGGENVYSIEVENVLYQHPAVLEAAVYGVPDETWGERVVAAVVLRPGRAASAEELEVFCRERLAAYKAPRLIRFLAELPRTGSGKLQKRALREG